VHTHLSLPPTQSPLRLRRFAIETVISRFFLTGCRSAIARYRLFWAEQEASQLRCAAGEWWEVCV
jgi:hypothetical protein